MLNKYDTHNFYFEVFAAMAVQHIGIRFEMSQRAEMWLHRANGAGNI